MSSNHSSEHPVGVLIVGQDRIFIDAMVAWLATCDDMKVIESTAEQRDLVDIVLVDASQGRDDARAAIWRVTEEMPNARVVVLGVENEDARLLELIEAGALGYLPRGASADELIQAVRDVHAGRTRCSPQIAGLVMARIHELLLHRQEPREHQPEPLTPRELEILTSIALGLSNKEIGKRLRISVSTVKNHVHNILEKMQVGQRREAIKIAYECGLLPDSLHPSARD